MSKNNEAVTELEATEHEGLEVQSDQEFTLDDMMGELDQPTPEQVKEQAKLTASEREAKAIKNRKFAAGINGTFWFAMGTRWLTPNAVAAMSKEHKDAGVDAFMPLAEKMDGEVPPWVMEMLEKYDWAIAAGMYLAPTVTALIDLEKQAKIEAAKAAEAAANDEEAEEQGTGTDGD